MDVRMSVQNLVDLPLFQGLDVEEISEVLSRVTVLVKRFRKSDYIFLAGDCVENLCIVVNGKVQMIKEDIWGDKSIIANLGAGSVFAESYLGRRHDKSIVSYFAASDSEVLMLPFGRFLENPHNSKAHNKLMCNIVAILADNNSRLIEKTEILCKKTLRGKILPTHTLLGTHTARQLEMLAFRADRSSLQGKGKQGERYLWRYK